MEFYMYTYIWITRKAEAKEEPLQENVKMENGKYGTYTLYEPKEYERIKRRQNGFNNEWTAKRLDMEGRDFQTLLQIRNGKVGSRVEVITETPQRMCPDTWTVNRNGQNAKATANKKRERSQSTLGPQKCHCWVPEMSPSFVPSKQQTSTHFVREGRSLQQRRRTKRGCACWGI